MHDAGEAVGFGSCLCAGALKAVHNLIRYIGREEDFVRSYSERPMVSLLDVLQSPTQNAMNKNIATVNVRRM